MTGPAADVLTVSAVAALARDLLEETFPWVRVRGEISRFLHHGSGHMYFQLKDRRAAISAVMFGGDNRRLRFRPEDGMDVLVGGRLSLYEPRGQFQLIASEMEPLGRGSLFLAFEQLKARLAAEGLFDDERKRALPMLPARIGIATSPTGAAIRDMLQVLQRRFADVKVLISPCRVQGEGAAAEIADAVDRLDRAGMDVILVARGGGSLEDLWAFNEEAVARAIAACATPVITGIGHEIDVTIADLVADRRAPTPSAAAELAVQDRLDLVRRLSALGRRLAGTTRLALSRGREHVRALRDHVAMRRVPRRLSDLIQQRDDLTARAGVALERGLTGRRSRLQVLDERLAPRSLRQRVRERREKLGHASHRLRAAARGGVDGRRADVRRLADLLGSFSPLAVLARGYSICHDGTGRVVRSHDDVHPDDAVTVRLHRGALECRVVRSVPPAPEEA